MAKLSKNTLKLMIKECLIEILSEGLGELGGISHAASFQDSFQRTQKNIQEVSEKSTKVENNKFESNTRNLINSTTEDPVLKDIFADTAKTTLQEQMSADSGRKGYIKPTDKISSIVDKSDPIELFGEASNNWASLAFSSKDN